MLERRLSRELRGNIEGRMRLRVGVCRTQDITGIE